jgi:hypothetical protein
MILIIVCRGDDFTEVLAAFRPDRSIATARPFGCRKSSRPGMKSRSSFSDGNLARLDRRDAGGGVAKMLCLAISNGRRCARLP